MKVFVEIIEKTQPEQVAVQCHKTNDQVEAIVRYVKATDGSLSGYLDGQIYQIFLQDIYYVETVDNRLFAYTQQKVYELKMKLYEFEALYKEQAFFRCSKAAIVNLMKIESVYAIFNGRLSARLFNKEEIIISRQYTQELKQWFSGGAV